MPRPAPKRSRTVGKNQNKGTDDPRPQDDAVKSPIQTDPRHSLRNQTPLTKSHEQAIESSPTGDRPSSRPGTGSRPPTRSRGYSSTLSFAGRKGDANSRIPGTPGFDNSVLSNFRRRPRQQSILQMMQADDDGSSDLDDDDFLGGLSPNDESTPLNLSRTIHIKSSSPLSSGSRKRKRMTQEFPEPELPVDIDDTPTATPCPREGEDNEDEVEINEAAQPLETLSQTVLPPVSSPAGSTHPEPTPQISLKKRTTHLSTASLQNRLLPRRRRRLSNDIVDDQHDAASGDEDELNYPSQRSRRAGKSKPKPLCIQDPKPRVTKKPTYSRSQGMDKENEMLSSPSSSPLSSLPESDVSDSESMVRCVSDELRAAIKKFAEVDQWQMEYEDVSENDV